MNLARMLSTEKVSNFLENTIGFKDWKNQLEDDKMTFIRKYMEHFATNIYYQNISMTSVHPDKRRGPASVSEIIDTGLSGKGGVCVELNYFSKLLLSSLGFNCISIQGTYPANPIEGNHCTSVIRLSETEEYLVDVGAVLPGLDPIPLHNLPYSFMEGGLLHQWRSEEDGSFRRYQLRGKLFKLNNDKYQNSEEMRVELSNEPKSFEDYRNPMHQVYTNGKRSFILQTPLLFRYMDRIEGETQKWVYIWGTTLLIGDEISRKVENYKNLQEIIPVVKKFFPKIDPIELEMSIEYFETVYKQSPQGF